MMSPPHDDVTLSGRYGGGEQRAERGQKIITVIKTGQPLFSVYISMKFTLIRFLFIYHQFTAEVV